MPGLIQRIIRLFRPGPIMNTVKCQVSATARALVLSNADHEMVVDWADIIRILAHKEDNVGHDTLVLEIDTGDDSSLQLREHDVDLQSANDLLKKHLPGMPRFHDWFTRVAFPAFEPNPTILWTREPAPVDAEAEPREASD